MTLNGVGILLTRYSDCNINFFLHSREFSGYPVLYALYSDCDPLVHERVYFRALH